SSLLNCGRMPRAGFAADEDAAWGIRLRLRERLQSRAFHVGDRENRASPGRQHTTGDVSPAVSAQCHMRGFGRLAGARRGDVADERVVGGIEEFDCSGVGQKNVWSDRNGRPIAPRAELTLQCCEQCSFVWASALQQQLLDLTRSAADVGRDERILLSRQAGDIEDTLEATGVRIDDRVAVAAEAVQLREKMLVAVD